MSPAILLASSLVNAKHFLPKSLSEAPIKYSSRRSIMRSRSWNASLVSTVNPPYCALNFPMSLAANLFPLSDETSSTLTPFSFKSMIA